VGLKQYGGMKMVLTRPFEERDNAALLAIEKLCPQGDEKLAMGVDKSPDIIARYRMYDNWKVLVAEEDGKIAGWTGWAVKHYPAQGWKYVYLIELMINPQFRRKGIGTKLVTEAEKNVRESGCGHIYCYIIETNEASRGLFKKLGYSKMRDIKICAISAYKKAKIEQRFKIERINKGDMGEAVSLINEYYAGRAHFVPYTPESFESYVNRIPAYGLENFWVVKEEGKIVACAGLWDCSVLQTMRYTREPFMWKVMNGIFGFMRLFTKMPRIPAEGEYFKVHYINDHAFKPESSEAMFNLIGHFNNILLDARRDFFGGMIDPDDALLGVVKKFSPQIESMAVYAKSIEKELPEFGAFYGDLRDAIL